MGKGNNNEAMGATPTLGLFGKFGDLHWTYMVGLVILKIFKHAITITSRVAMKKI